MSVPAEAQAPTSCPIRRLTVCGSDLLDLSLVQLLFRGGLQLLLSDTKRPGLSQARQLRLHRRSALSSCQHRPVPIHRGRSLPAHLPGAGDLHAPAAEVDHCSVPRLPLEGVHWIPVGCRIAQCRQVGDIVPLAASVVEEALPWLSADLCQSGSGQDGRGRSPDCHRDMPPAPAPGTLTH